MKQSDNKNSGWVGGFIQGVYLLIKKTKLEYSIRKKEALLQEHYQSLGLDALRQDPKKYQDRGVDDLLHEQVEKSVQEVQSQRQHLDELTFLFKKEEKQFRDSLNELNQKKDLCNTSRDLARDLLKKFNLKLKRKLEETGKQKKEFTVLTIFKGRFDANKTVFEIEGKIKDAKQAFEQAEDSLNSVDQKITNTSRQWDLMRFKLSQEVKAAEQALKVAEKAHGEKNMQRMKQLALIGREEFAQNPGKHASHGSQIQTLNREIADLTSDTDYCREKILESRKAMALGFVAMALMIVALVVLKSHFSGGGDFSP